jgi:hypothetical protein
MRLARRFQTAAEQQGSGPHHPLDNHANARYDLTMTATLEHIKKELRTLAPGEIGALIGDLRRDYSAFVQNDEADEASIEAEWDSEIDARVKEIEDGTVQPLTPEESDHRTEAVFAKFGINRPVFRP